MTTTHTWMELSVVEERVCDIASQYFYLPRHEVRPTSRMIEDLGCDSLSIMELLMKLEDEFLAHISTIPNNPIAKTIFMRQPFCLSDLAEIVYLQQGRGKPVRQSWRRTPAPDSDCSTLPFSQLGGCWVAESSRALFEPLEFETDRHQFRRCSDGMRCILLPAAQTEIGSDSIAAQSDERPVHTVQLDSFLMDAEPVSTTAYCRFLNSVAATDANLLDWFVLDPTDDRVAQMPIARFKDTWRPVAGAETMPMVLVSWYGANAYSLWAHGKPWSGYRSQDGFLPSEAEWEYAAQGAFCVPASDKPQEAAFVFGQHTPGTKYEADTLPMAAVHLPLGKSVFGLHHMAGNIWQWCRDWYACDFYQRPESRDTNPVNACETGVRSERGGSWVGPIELCRPTYRRGRVPLARGRCLGFRCISPVELLPRQRR